MPWGAVDSKVVPRPGCYNGGTVIPVTVLRPTCYCLYMKDIDYKIPGRLITTSPEWLGGEPCFTGRRVPVKALFDYLKGGHTLEAFLEAYPAVSRAHAVAVIDLANRAVSAPVAAE